MGRGGYVHLRWWGLAQVGYRQPCMAAPPTSVVSSTATPQHRPLLAPVGRTTPSTTTLMWENGPTGQQAGSPYRNRPSGCRWRTAGVRVVKYTGLRSSAPCALLCIGLATEGSAGRRAASAMHNAKAHPKAPSPLNALALRLSLSDLGKHCHV